MICVHTTVANTGCRCHWSVPSAGGPPCSTLEQIVGHEYEPSFETSIALRLRNAKFWIKILRVSHRYRPPNAFLT